MTTSTSTEPRFVEVRGESGKLYGLLDTRTGVLHVRKGRTGNGNGETDRVNLAAQVGPYLAAVKGEREAR